MLERIPVIEEGSGISAEHHRVYARYPGVEQAWKYRNALYECCALIGRSPEAGRACDALAPGLRRMEEGKHIIFYKSANGKVVISRILHQRVLPRRRYFIDS